MKDTKSTKFISKISEPFVVFVLLWLRVFAACANFARIPNC